MYIAGLIDEDDVNMYVAFGGATSLKDIDCKFKVLGVATDVATRTSDDGGEYTLNYVVILTENNEEIFCVFTQTVVGKQLITAYEEFKDTWFVVQEREGAKNAYLALKPVK